MKVRFETSMAIRLTEFFGSADGMSFGVRAEQLALDKDVPPLNTR